MDIGSGDISSNKNIEFGNNKENKSQYCKGLLERTIKIFESLEKIQVGEKVYFNKEEGQFGSSGESLRNSIFVKPFSFVLPQKTFQWSTTAIGRWMSSESIETTLIGLETVNEELHMTMNGIKDFVSLSDDLNADHSEWKETALEVLSRLNRFKNVYTTTKVGMNHLFETYQSKNDPRIKEKLGLALNDIDSHIKKVIDEAERMLTTRLNSIEENQKKINPASSISATHSIEKEENHQMEGAEEILIHFPEIQNDVPELKFKINQEIVSQKPEAQSSTFNLRKLEYLCKIADNIFKTGNIKDYKEQIKNKTNELELLKSKEGEGEKCQQMQKELDRLILYEQAVAFAQERSLRAKNPLAQAFISRLQNHVDYIVLARLIQNFKK